MAVNLSKYIGRQIYYHPVLSISLGVTGYSYYLIRYSPISTNLPIYLLQNSSQISVLIGSLTFSLLHIAKIILCNKSSEMELCEASEETQAFKNLREWLQSGH